MEFELHDDPKDYIARPIFGKFSNRSLLTWVLFALFVVPICVIGYLYQLNENFTMIFCALGGIPIILIGQYKRKGLYMEEYLPIAWKAFHTPKFSFAYPPDVFIERPSYKPTRADKKARKCLEQQRNKDRKEQKEDEKDAASFINTLVKAQHLAAKKKEYQEIDSPVREVEPFDPDDQE